jgi:hypothetical protein
MGPNDPAGTTSRWPPQREGLSAPDTLIVVRIEFGPPELPDWKWHRNQRHDIHDPELMRGAAPQPATLAAP